MVIRCSNNLVDNLYRSRKEEDRLLTIEVHQYLEGSLSIDDCLHYTFAYGELDKISTI